jgi:predicted XRE-type DNA-binding protein
MARHAAEKLKRPPATYRNASTDQGIPRRHRREPIPPPAPQAHFQSQEHDTMRALLMSAVRNWVLAQHLPQRVIADRLQVPRAAVSDIIRSKSNYAAEKLLDLWLALGGRWELRLTLGEAGEKDVAAPQSPGAPGAGTLSSDSQAGAR